jgi:SAM-dependent methyltransferase
MLGPARAAAQESAAQTSDDDSAITVPTPPDIVLKMLEVAKVGKGDLLYDLGCGDGRIVVAAASRYGCRAVGYDINPRMIRESRQNVEKHRLQELVRIEQQDIFKLDLREASVITLYLLPEMNDQLVPQLKQLKAGSRIVCHEFPIDGFHYDRLVTMKSSYDGVPRDIYLYKLPLKKRTEEAGSAQDH